MSSVLLYKEPTNKYHLGTYMRDSLSNAMRQPQVWNSLLEVMFCLADVYCIHLSSTILADSVIASHGIPFELIAPW